MAPTNPDDLAAALAKFRDMAPRLESARLAVKRELERTLRDSGINAAVTSRIKTVASYRSKVSRKNYTDPWADVTDKIGVRVIVEQARDVDKVHQAVKEAAILTIANFTDFRRPTSFDRFDYAGLHLDVNVPREPGDTEPLTCEIQVRTIAQDAWSVVSHKLVYKPDVELPVSAKRAVHRLMALVEVFDEEVDRVTQRHLAIINTRRLTVLTEAAESNYRQFADNQWSAAISARVLDCVGTTIADSEIESYRARLADFVDANRDALEIFYAEYGAGSVWDADPHYTLFTQPESVAILERLEHVGHDLLSAWRDAELPEEWLRSLAKYANTTIEI